MMNISAFNFYAISGCRATVGYFKHAAQQTWLQAHSMQSALHRGLTPAGLGVLPVSMILAAAGGGVCHAQQAGNDPLATLQASIAKQQAKLNQEEVQLEQESLELDQQQRLLDLDMAKLRGAGTSGAGETAMPAAPASDAATQQAASSAASPSGTVGEQQQQQAQQNQQQQTKIILQSSTVLSNTGGVLTPKGQFVIDPSLEYDYWSQSQLALNGFTIIPGITFGNIFIARIEQNFLTAAVTARYGVTDRMEVNVKIPFVVGYGTTTTQAVGVNAKVLSPDARNAHIGDIQLGASYQFNNGDNGWPVFVGNLLFKSATGQSPYNIPIYTVNDPNGGFLEGIGKKLPTGTGFYAVEPSITIFYPTDPGVIFGNFQYIKSFSRGFDIASPGGGAPVHANLQPGGALSATFGLGFALNDKTSMTFSYQHEHVFGSSVDSHHVPGSSYDFGTFNFGIGEMFSERTSVDLGVGIGAGPGAPVAKILIEVPMRF